MSAPAGPPAPMPAHHPVSAVTVRIPLLEREGGLATLDQALDRARSGRGTTVLLRGEAGIGKSALLRHWTEQTLLAQQSTQVLWGVCDALFTPRPMGPVLDLASGLGPDVRGAVSQRNVPGELYAAVADVVRRPEGPMHVLIIEDAHWADHLTLDFLKYMGRRLAAWPVVLVVTYRDDEVGPMHPLMQVVGELPNTSTVAIDLEPLGLTAIELLTGSQGTLAKDLHQATGGNPFFATEVIAATRREGTVPTTVSSAVLARMQRVSPKAREVLEVASLEPRSVEYDLLVTLVGEEGALAIESCVQVGLLRWADRGVSFRHELARRAVEATWSPQRRREAHARYHALLGMRGDDVVDRMAYHASQAHDGEAVLRSAPLAGQRASALGARREAAAHYASALAYVELAPDDLHATLLERWATEASESNTPQKSLQSARERALALRRKQGDMERVAANLRALAGIHLRTGERARGIELLDESVQVLEARTPGPELARAYSQRSSMYMTSNQWSEAIAWGERAIELADSLNLNDVRASALNNVGSCLADAGDMKGFEYLERSLAIAQEHALRSDEARAWVNGGEAAVRNRLLPRAQVWLERGLEFAKQHDIDRLLPMLAGSLANAHVARGQFQAALNLRDEYVPFAPPDTITGLALQAAVATVEVVRDGPDRCAGLDALWQRALPLHQPDEIVPVALACAEAAWLNGDLQACANVVEQAVKACANLTLWDWGELACWYHRCGRNPDTLSLAPMATPCEAEIEGDWVTARRLWREREMPRHEAWVALFQEAQEGVTTKAQAAMLFEQVGAKACAAHARLTLGKQAKPNSSIPFGLTSREWQVAQQLAQGLSSPQIAQALSRSERTVEHHVANVLSKLGAKRRSEVAMKLEAAGLDASTKP
jgi:DNA-binding CsgD family transcriptional regulator/tetratricopeptide (TPR) repeat protein